MQIKEREGLGSGGGGIGGGRGEGWEGGGRGGREGGGGRAGRRKEVPIRGKFYLAMHATEFYI